MTHTKTAVCPRCGNPRQSALPGVACPHCLMALGMYEGVGTPTTAPNAHAMDQAHVPPIEKLVSEFPDLEIQHLIGHGGMGAVYQARQVNLDRIVALKILSPRLSCDPAFAERFLREARTLAKLSHPNIVTVFDFGQAGEFYYLTMEFVDGVNLRDTISAKLLSPTEALAIVPQVCEALQYAHDNGVVHRDIKPENILIAKNGKIKIADFGLAKLLQSTPDQFTLTGTRQILGTRNYMAPEQIESPDVVDHRADLYSLGVVFYELLTGELPLGRFALPSEKTASISNLLDDVVMRTLEKDPDRRYQQARQIKTACESIEPPRPIDAQASDHEYDSDAIPICRPFPVTIEDIYAGLASGYGMMRGYQSHMELEYEVRDSVMDHNWGSAKIQVPLERVTSIRMHKGLIYTYIEVQADRFEVVSKIPNSKRGMFRMYLKKQDRDSGEQFVQCVNEIIGNVPMPKSAPPSPPMPPVPPVKAYVVAPRLGSNGRTNNLLAAILLFLFLSFCVAGAAVLILGSLWFSASAPAPKEAPSQHVLPVAIDSPALSTLEPISPDKPDVALEAEPTSGSNKDSNVEGEVEGKKDEGKVENSNNSKPARDANDSNQDKR